MSYKHRNSVESGAAGKALRYAHCRRRCNVVVVTLDYCRGSDHLGCDVAEREDVRDMAEMQNRESKLGWGWVGGQAGGGRGGTF